MGLYRYGIFLICIFKERHDCDYSQSFLFSFMEYKDEHSCVIDMY